MAEIPGSRAPMPHDNGEEGIAPQIPDPQDAPVAEASPEVMARFWEALKRLPAYIRLAAGLAKDPEVPNKAKGVLAVGGGYAVSPIDLVPGVIPVAGQLDDLYVMLTALSRALKMTPDEVATRHLAAAGVSQSDIDNDLQAVRDLVRAAVKKSLVYGGKALGRFSRAAFKLANTQRKRWTGGRPAGSSGT